MGGERSSWGSLRSGEWKQTDLKSVCSWRLVEVGVGNTVAETDLVKKCVREDHGEGVLGQVEVGQLGEKGCRQHELFQLDVMGDGQPLQLDLGGVASSVIW